MIDSQGNTLLYKNYQKYVDVMNSLDGIVTVGMYNDELVIEVCEAGVSCYGEL